MKFKFAVLLMVVSFSSMSSASSLKDLPKDDKTISNLMLTSKYAGLCGMYGQMVQFQQSTKMAGGDEFMERFINTELSRMNIDLVQFARQCKQSIEIYDTYYQAGTK